MKERNNWELPKLKEMGNLEAALHLAGQLAKKTATLTAKITRSIFKDCTLTALGSGLFITSVKLVENEIIEPYPMGLISIGLLGLGLVTEIIPRADGKDRINLLKVIPQGLTALRRNWTIYKRSNGHFL